MKKSFLFLTILISAIAVQAQQAGRVRVSFNGFRCIRETLDDMLQLDGKGDEVFFQFYFTLANSSGQQKLKYAYRSDTYGDNYGPFGNRINAGSCVDLFGNLKGGIKGGDNYSCNNIIGEYDLGAGDVLTVMPTIWEWDPGNPPANENFESRFDASIEGAYSTINQNASSLSNARFRTTGLVGATPGDALGLILVDAGTFLSFKLAMNLVGALTPKPRPIGITKDGTFSPKAVLLNANTMQQIASSNFGYGQGVIPLQYNEEALGNDRDRGNYIILLKVDFFPAANSNTNNNTNTNTTFQPGSMKPLSKTTTVSAPVAQTAPAAPVSLPGTWTGTWGSGASNGPNYYSFRFNADGSMQLLGQNGAVLANGRYTFTNNQLNGSYTYSTGGTYNYAGTLDASNTLNGNWSAGAGGSGNGKWMLKKTVSATTNLR